MLTIGSYANLIYWNEKYNWGYVSLITSILHLILNTLKTILHLAIEVVKEIIKSNSAPKTMRS